MNRRNTKHKCSDSLSVIKDEHIVRQNEKTYMRKEQTVQPSIRRVLIRELKQHAKCTKMKNARAKCAKLSFFIILSNTQICGVLAVVFVVIA